MKVSVAIVAYNHEAYIEQAIRNVLAQRTNFDYEIVVGEDYSTDRTLDILISLQKQFPEKIRLLTTDHNLGMIRNSIRTIQACNGEYIALLDGDDYWCVVDKLQKQVDFLDQHPDYSICFHSVIQEDQDGIREPKVLQPAQVKDVFEISDLISSNFIPTCSILLRNGLIDTFPNWIHSLDFLDWPIFVFTAKHGKVKFLDEVMGVYRVHSAGFWSSMDPMKRLKAYIIFFENLDPYLNYHYTKQIQNNLAHYWRKLMDLLYERAIVQDTDKAARAFVQENYSSLKEMQSLPREWKTELLERVYCHYLIGNYERGNYPAAWSAWIGLMRNSPALLRNRGLLIIGVESTLNGRLRPLMQLLKRSQGDGHDE